MMRIEGNHTEGTTTTKWTEELLDKMKNIYKINMQEEYNKQATCNIYTSET